MEITIGLLAMRAAFVAAQPSPGQSEFFESRIRPVLAHECYECHSSEGKKKGGLLLDSRPGWQAGGESGEVIIPGKARASLLIQTIRHEHDDLKMPKDGAKLSDKGIADFEKWINDGAYDPRDKPASKAELAQATDWKTILERRKREWWCFQPLQTIPQPGGGHPVDAFIEAKLREHGFAPSPTADAAVIRRRLSFVLTGLPPEGEDGKMGRRGDKERLVSPTHRLMVSASSPIDSAAVNSEIDRLLASPRFGEKWARHWLDWVRYAESYGSEGDPEIPYAWRYRDYVIRAFNDDVPYPQMIREAIAGDLLPQPRINSRLGLNESALGIAQLRMVLHGFSPVDSLDEMASFTDNQIDTVTKAFQAMTVSCARCHNHKFDPISQTDFYALYGIFTSTHPAVIDASAVDDHAVREQMCALKDRIKQVVGGAWLKDLPPGEQSHESHPSDDPGLRWFSSGKGIFAQPTPAGEFAVVIEGDRIIERIHPRGWFSGLLSTKDSAVLVSPRIQCEGGTLWMRVAGEGGARARYIVQNYPRTGNIHKMKEFKAAGDATLAWQQLDLEYWKGDEIFVQCTTAADMPAEAKPDQRSWFGITDWRITKKNEPPPSSPPSSGDLRAAITAWMRGDMSDAQAELLDLSLRTGRLTNHPAKIAGAEPLLAKYRELEARLPPPVRAPGVIEADATDRPLFVQGNHKQPGDMVKRRFLEALDSSLYHASDSGRLQLAESIADMERNPLTARVMVNRIWHHVFGRGIVSSTDNFGRLGELPTHPELLDYLARRFIDSGGSIKDMVRLLVTSQTFRRSDRAPPGAVEKDPDNKLLSHWSVRRLEAEAIRDSILQLTGELDSAAEGASVSGGEMRRSVFVKVIRNSLDDFLTTFDAPVPSGTRGRRDVTNVPAQSLTLLNDPRVQGWAALWAKRAMTAGSAELRIQRLFAEAFARQPSEKEKEECIAFVTAAARSADAQRSELAKIEAEVAGLRSEIEAVLGPAREKLTAQSVDAAQKETGPIPGPFAEWDFEDGPKDLQGRLPLVLHGNARIERGALILDGGKSFARTQPLPKPLKAKTLEVWVMLDSLDQRGGGVITVQDHRGDVFDSIVYAEKEARCWVPGSNFFKRSKLLEGPAEDEAARRAVHVAIVYDADGTVTAYRDGARYGRPYKSDGPAVFAANESEIQLGCRHGDGGGNRMLAGRIFRARVYERALTAAEIRATRHLERIILNESDVLEALDGATRDEVKSKQARLLSMSAQARKLREQIESLGGGEHAWASLALSLINMKEFVYLR